MNIQDILTELKKNADSKSIKGMQRFGITPDKTFGVRIPILRQIAKKAGKDHKLAQELWKINTRETRILSSMIEEIEYISDEEMETYIAAFNYWEICDQFCMNLFEKLPFAYEKAQELAKRPEEFALRIGFVLMARLAVSDKKSPDEKFEPFLQLIYDHSTDERNMVKKAVNWALRQIGKRNTTLHKKAIEVAEKIEKIDDPTARWIAKDALQELRDEKIIKRIKNG
ncbi:MAG TPA: DNA alkylation repair protein [Candidatus Cloacimonetes bacterium]|nr:DNA alkylation repair protein [Candidatus Cloacimonadota bacterium]HEX37984.1 DNA alkylation repair protein [Candidatus Cloacimonadota bacterium]